MAKEGAAAEILGPALDPEQFIVKHRALASREAAAASEAGERRQEIGALFEDMRLENKAAGQARAILKMKNEGKQRDAVRTWQQLLPMLVERVLDGEQDELELHPKNGTEDEAAVDPLDDKEPYTDEESAEFNDAVTETYNENVTPIDFGGATA